MYRELSDAVAKSFCVMLGLIVIFVPLGIWKLIDIIIWLYHHVSIGIK
jgi:hypothetical protein